MPSPYSEARKPESPEDGAVRGTASSDAVQETGTVACMVVDAPFQEDAPGFSLALDDDGSEAYCTRCGSWSAVCGPTFCGRGA